MLNMLVKNDNMQNKRLKISDFTLTLTTSFNSFLPKLYI